MKLEEVDHVETKRNATFSQRNETFFEQRRNKGRNPSLSGGWQNIVRFSSAAFGRQNINQRVARSRIPKFSGRKHMINSGFALHFSFVQKKFRFGLRQKSFADGKRTIFRHPPKHEQKLRKNRYVHIPILNMWSHPGCRRDTGPVVTRWQSHSGAHPRRGIDHHKEY